MKCLIVICLGAINASLYSMQPPASKSMERLSQTDIRYAIKNRSHKSLNSSCCDYCCGYTFAAILGLYIVITQRLENDREYSYKKE